jgi:hypothetical protein
MLAQSRPDAPMDMLQKCKKIDKHCVSDMVSQNSEISSDNGFEAFGQIKLTRSFGKKGRNSQVIPQIVKEKKDDDDEMC